MYLNVFQTNEIYRKTIGDLAGACIVEQRKVIPRLEFKVENDKTPLWKKLSVKGECDVLSVLNLKSEELSLKNQIKKEFYDRMIAQIHLNRGWEDVFFLRELLANPNFNIKQCKNTFGKLDSIAAEGHDKLMQRLRMLYSRKPIYTFRKLKYRKAEAALKHMQGLLFHMQYQNRQTAFGHLDRIKQLRRKGQVNEFALFTQKVLSEFYLAMSYKAFPRKFEFVVELCNLLGVTYLQELKVPQDIMKMDLSERMFSLFAVPVPKDNVVEKTYIFGVKSTWNDPLKVDTSFLKYK